MACTSCLAGHAKLKTTTPLGRTGETPDQRHLGDVFGIIYRDVADSGSSSDGGRGVGFGIFGWRHCRRGRRQHCANGNDIALRIAKQPLYSFPPDSSYLMFLFF